MGPIEKSVRLQIQAMLPLKHHETSLARVAFRLASSLDQEEADERTLASLSKELRSILVELMEGRGEEDGLQLGSPT